jgi:hypothetical protein
VLPAAPPDLALNSWRDPFIVRRPRSGASRIAAPAPPTTIDLPNADTSAACGTAASPDTQEGGPSAANSRSDRWQLLIGTGIVGGGEVQQGSALAYSSEELTSGGLPEVPGAWNGATDTTLALRR